MPDSQHATEGVSSVKTFFQLNRMFCVITQTEVSHGQEQCVSLLQDGHCQFCLSEQIQFLPAHEVNTLGKKALQIVQINMKVSQVLQTTCSFKS